MASLKERNFFIIEFCSFDCTRDWNNVMWLNVFENIRIKVIYKWKLHNFSFSQIFFLSNIPAKIDHP